MRYLEAFNNMINQYGISVLEDNDITRSILSDLVENSFLDNQLVDAFCLLNKGVSLYEYIKNQNLTEAKNIIKGFIIQQGNKYSKTDFIKSVEPLLLYLYPNEYVPISNRNGIRVSRQKPIADKRPELFSFIDLINSPICK